MQGVDKNAIIDNVWQYSHYYAQSLQTCEILYKEGQGIACLNVLFNVFENVSKSVIEVLQCSTNIGYPKYYR